MARGAILNAKNGLSSIIKLGQAVRITGSDSQKNIIIGLASNSSESSLPAVGLAVQDIAPGQVGTIKTVGLITKINTSQANPGTKVSTGSNGQVIYGDVPTNDISQFLGVVVESGVEGSIYLFPTQLNDRVSHDRLSGIEADDHHDENHNYRHRRNGPDELSHSILAGLKEDSHTQYLLADGTRDIDGDFTINGALNTPLQSRVSVTMTGTGTASASAYNVFDSDNWSAFSSTNNIASVRSSYTSSTGRFTTDIAGTYMVTATLFMNASFTTNVTLTLRKSGSTIYTVVPIVNSSVDPTERTISLLTDLTTNHYLEVFVDSATANTIAMVAGTTFSMYKIG